MDWRLPRPDLSGKLQNIIRHLTVLLHEPYLFYLLNEIPRAISLPALSYLNTFQSAFFLTDSPLFDL